MTKTIIETTLKSDPTVTDAERKSAIAALEGRSATTLTDPEPLDEALSRNEVARILNVCPRTVTIYAQRGFLRRFCGGPKRMRASGYSRRSVKEFQTSTLTGNAMPQA